jgi:hypothetical protein
LARSSDWVADDDGAVESAENLVSDRAVMVRVIPIHAGRVIRRQLVVVVKGCAGLNSDEGVVPVAFRGDVQAVHMQVGRVVEPINQLDP